MAKMIRFLLICLFSINVFYAWSFADEGGTIHEERGRVEIDLNLLNGFSRWLLKSQEFERIRNGDNGPNTANKNSSIIEFFLVELNNGTKHLRLVDVNTQQSLIVFTIDIIHQRLRAIHSVYSKDELKIKLESLRRVNEAFLNVLDKVLPDHTRHIEHFQVPDSFHIQLIVTNFEVAYTKKGISELPKMIEMFIRSFNLLNRNHLLNRNCLSLFNERIPPMSWK